MLAGHGVSRARAAATVARDALPGAVTSTLPREEATALIIELADGQGRLERLRTDLRPLVDDVDSA